MLHSRDRQDVGETGAADCSGEKKNLNGRKFYKRKTEPRVREVLRLWMCACVCVLTRITRELDPSPGPFYYVFYFMMLNIL